MKNRHIAKEIKTTENYGHYYYNMCVCVCVCVCVRVCLFANPSTRAGCDTKSIFKRGLAGLNSEFSFS